jgi:hypothetical protein
LVITEIRSKERSAPMIVTTKAMKVAGFSCGRMMYQSIFQPLAPSSRPASICSGSPR